MSASNGNVAYDLSLYEKKSSKKSAEQQPQRHVKSSKAIRLKRIKHTSSLKMPKAFNSFNSLNSKELKWIATAGMAFCALAVFFTISINYQAKENELTSAIEKSEAELTSLQNDYDGLMVQYDTKMSDAAIEEYAKNTLGMQKRENFQLEWITIGEEDDFENENTKNGGFVDWLASYFD